MYAVIETGGKQYRVEVGTELEVELLDGEPGESVTLDRILLIADGEQTAVGQPVVANATVQAEVVRRERGDKLIVFKYRPKARRRVKKGHRQEHTILRIADITLDGRSAAEAARKEQDAARSERQRLEEAAARQAAADAELAAKLAKQSKAAKAPKPGRAGRSAKAAASESATEPVVEAAPEAEAAPKRSRAKAGPVEVEAPTEAEAATETEPATEAAPETEASATDSGDAADSDAAADTTTDDTEPADAPKRSRTKKDE
jgi:large subunit ribosomal protein L21